LLSDHEKTNAGRTIVTSGYPGASLTASPE
jgi:hypothetical protein